MTNIYQHPVEDNLIDCLLEKGFNQLPDSGSDNLTIDVTNKNFWKCSQRQCENFKKFNLTFIKNDSVN